ncbi:hypothetical protein JTE90_013352 [Oedothorax gibbosus]|uniref:Uncharacterized protein n=1 Tax=Oedothorax gibbosus TaxID=931172 RepID=A0AAV6TWV9_9ARAC|nr:hypothetical protein JTE90_013352 [Oedothorax gibbosus]
MGISSFFRRAIVCRPASSVPLNDASLATWDVETVVEAKWGPKTYPANLVQFGENNKEMEVVIDKLAEGMDIKEVPLIQPGVGGKEKLKKRFAENSNNKIQLKKQKSINENMFKEVKQRILSDKAVQATTEVVKKHETP